MAFTSTLRRSIVVRGASLMLGAALLVAGCGAAPKPAQPAGGGSPTGAQDAKPVTIRLAHTATPDQAVAQGFQKFAELVKQKSGGQITIQIYDSSTLIKSDPEGVKQIRSGNLEMSGGSVGNMGEFTKDFYFFNLPYLFHDLSVLPKMWHSKIGSDIAADLDKTLGVRPLLWLPNGGWQVLENRKRPVKVPDDLKGLKMRARPDPVEVSLLGAWGASATSVSWPEVYTALSQGTVDGEILQYTWLYFTKHNEVVKYATEVTATPGPTFLGLISSKVWDGLTPQQQKVMTEAAGEAEDYTYKLDDQQVTDARAKAVASGLQVYVPSADEMKLWREKGQSVWSQFTKDIPAGLLDQIQALQK